MAVNSVMHPTLLDVAKRTDPNGKIEGIAELLTEMNPVLKDAVFMEANHKTSHQVTVRTGWPTPTWTKMNVGVEPQKSTTRQITFNCGMLKEFSEVSAELIELANNTSQFRMSEEIAFIDSMNAEMADTMFYGDEGSEPASFTGFSRYFNDRTSAQNKDQIINAGGSGSALRSIWIIGWGMNSMYMIYPEGWKAGLDIEDLGRYMSQTAPIDGKTDRTGRMFVYGTHYKWSCGLVMKDWRYAVRIANIDKTTLRNDSASGADLVDLIHQGLNQIRNLNSVRPAIYADRDIVSWLDRQRKYKVDESTLDMKDLYGEGVFALTARGVPIHYCDALDNNETAV